ncbi:hypothetical protein MKD41_07200 [Lutibacter sp. A64]|uniref:hypothetical protein n=1 Tax=Lutibacter sp. A64 TaxID=2918526 RepID=UPI001F06FA86|nr:hypothetical protein [Lutibacter sp. A64]UMB55251.1 hypothetical protein MKD41_07200 [Lutibacter sp. A64]
MLIIPQRSYHIITDSHHRFRKHRNLPSMTEKYDPYENAIAERINGILKQEFSVAQKIQDFKV